MRRSRIWIVLFVLTVASAMAHADVGLLLEQPIGRMGRISATGHAAIYLSRVCAESPTRLRRCRTGEAGVVLGRYNNVDQHDWIAIPLLAYLYAVDQPQQIPDLINAETEERLRDQYRRAHLETLIPDGPDGKPADSHWFQLLGSAYDRKIYVYEIETSAEQDDLLIQELNARPNKKRYNFMFRNCANFAESVLNFYYPHATHRSFTADFGLATPKQIAKSFVSYGEHHTDLRFSIFVIPQVPGKIHRSGKIYGVLEAVLKKKQYAVPLVIWHPFVAAAMVATYIVRGRFNPGQDSVALNRKNEVEALLRDAVPPNEKMQSGQMEKVSVKSLSGSRNEDCSSGDRCRSEAVTEYGNTGMHLSRSQ